MGSRREFLRDTIAATAAAIFPSAGRALEAHGRREQIAPFLVLYDDTVAAGAQFGAAAARRGLTVRAIGADAGTVWMREIEPRLAARPAPLAGLTSGPTAFCLEYLARTRGLRLVYRIEHAYRVAPGTVRPAEARHRPTGPGELRANAARLAASGLDWPIAAAELAAGCPAALRPAAPIELLDLAARGGEAASSFYSWLMAPPIRGS